MRSNEEFLEKLNIIQPKIIVLGKYNGSFAKILVKDENNIEYLSQPANLLAGQKPSIRLAVNKNKCFEIKSKLIHGNTYDYSKVDYKYNYSKVKIICPIHGEFYQPPSDHLKGNGCRKCAFEKQSYSFEDFYKKASNWHNNKYKYIKSTYIDYHSKMTMICPIHGPFEQTPASHVVTKVGCPKCIKRMNFSKSSWLKFCNNNKNSDPKVYIIRCFNDTEEFIKIGITNRTIFKRFSAKKLMPYSYEVIKEIKGSADFVWNKEKDLHKKYKSFKYKPQIPFAGQTECFTLEILKSLPS